MREITLLGSTKQTSPLRNHVKMLKLGDDVLMLEQDLSARRGDLSSRSGLS